MRHRPQVEGGLQAALRASSAAFATSSAGQLEAHVVAPLGQFGEPRGGLAVAAAETEETPAARSAGVSLHGRHLRSAFFPCSTNR